MDVLEAIKTRQTIRKFKQDIPSDEDIKTILDAARLAPSSSNSQMWHYIAVINNDIKLQMKNAVIAKYEEIESWEESKNDINTIEHFKHFSTFFDTAPVVIAALMEPKSSIIQDILIKRGMPHSQIERHRPHPDIQSMGASIENISLTAHALGYGTCWMCAPLFAYEKLEEILEVKKPFNIVSLICLGIPQNAPKNKIPKKQLDEIVTIIK